MNETDLTTWGWLVPLMAASATLAEKINEYNDTGDKITASQQEIDFLKAMILFKEKTKDRTMSLKDMYAILNKLQDGY